MRNLRSLFFLLFILMIAFCSVTISNATEIKHVLQMDTNLDNAKYGKEGIHIEGWKLATEKDTKLEVYLDNSKVDDKYIKYSRKYALTSIVKGYGTEIENPQPHYDIDIPTETLVDKIYKLQIRFVRNNGEILEKIEKNIIIDKSIKFLLNIDTNLNNVKFDYKGIHIEGWKLATEKDTKLEVYLDNTKVDDKYIKYSRKYALTSIVKGYGTEIENPQPHYDIDIPTESLEVKTYNLQIRFVRKNGGILQDVEKNIGVNNVFFQLHIESIFDRNTITNEEHELSGWLMTNSNKQNVRLMLDGQYQNNVFERSKRQDVNNYFNNIYSEQNPTAGFSTKIDFSKLSLGLHQIAIRVFDENNVKYGEVVIYIFLRNKVTYEEGTYGKSGYAYIKDPRGSDLKYYRYGDGPNVLFATFSVHGFEDNWDHDGAELTYIANKFYNELKNNHKENFGLADKWTIYIFPCVNPDGQKYGTTNNGPGRTTMYSMAPENQGIDLNRCWKYSGFNENTKSRNYAGTAPFQAFEASFLKDFLISHKSTNGQTVLVDLHGWLQQLVGDREVGMYYACQFPENNGYSLDRYGDGYLIGWARTALANNGRLAKTSLIELPENCYSHKTVLNQKYAERYIHATLSMLNGII